MKNRLMPIVFEIEEEDVLSTEKKEKLLSLFQKISFRYRVLSIRFSKNEDVVGYIVVNDNSEWVLRKIIGEFNDLLNKEGFEYSMYLPVVCDGVVFKRPTFYPFGELIVSK